MGYIEPLMRRNFLEYASYVIIDRAIPDLRDGCKPVQRRILNTLFEIDDGRFHKVANVIGETMKLHPHGDASIGDALVVLANKDYFVERQGNFGSVLTGHPAAAARYIECRLTPLARETLFNKKLTRYQPSYDSRKDEPIYLPAKLPVVLLIGVEGIAVGMSTRILPHNFCELLEGQIALLEGRTVALLPDFLQGGLMDAGEYDQGRGRVRVRARLEIAKDRKTIVVRQVPFGTTTESLIQSIETAAQKGKIKVSSIDDRTAEHVEIVLSLPRGIYADEVEPQLYAYTQCEVSITGSPVVIADDRPETVGVDELLTRLTDQLRGIIRAELELEQGELLDKQHWLTLEQIFIENRVYQRIEEARTADAVRAEVRIGMEQFRAQFLRDLTEDDIDRLLKIPIRRISLYDIEKYRREMDAVAEALAICARKLKHLTDTCIAYLRDLLDRYGAAHPRRTEIVSFGAVSKKEVARATLRVSYDPESGFFGTDVKGSEYSYQVSEYAHLLIVMPDATYRVVRPSDKLYLGPKVLGIVPFDDETGQVITLLYRDADRCAWAKRVHVTGFIRDKEYSLIRDPKGRLDRLWIGEPDKTEVRMLFVPSTRMRKKQDVYDLRDLPAVGLGARGKRMSTKPVASLKVRKPTGDG
ncbi:MAG: DNA topoisomerase IV subunit A [Acidobacteriota bacterium]